MRNNHLVSQGTVRRYHASKQRPHNRVYSTPVQYTRTTNPNWHWQLAIPTA
ncbi:hypothetical protein [Lactiplantibacillus fabifermentans]|nr:hypothetical protein [Lactiplantibacillus fabifermentans]ETY74395.1 hypothetical protein LFAB_07690 [Lactiplantibacillus fabifermentans T30PCM01]